MTWWTTGWRKTEAQVQEPVNVNEKLLRFSDADLEALAESSLMTAQESLSRMHMNTDDKAFYMDRAQTHAHQAHQALSILHDRHFS